MAPPKSILKSELKSDLKSDYKSLKPSLKSECKSELKPAKFNLDSYSKLPLNNNEFETEKKHATCDGLRVGYALHSKRSDLKYDLKPGLKPTIRTYAPSPPKYDLKPAPRIAFCCGLSDHKLHLKRYPTVSPKKEYEHQDPSPGGKMIPWDAIPEAVSWRATHEMPDEIFSLPSSVSDGESARYKAEKEKEIFKELGKDMTFDDYAGILREAGSRDFNDAFSVNHPESTSIDTAAFMSANASIVTSNSLVHGNILKAGIAFGIIFGTLLLFAVLTTLCCLYWWRQENKDKAARNKTASMISGEHGFVTSSELLGNGTEMVPVSSVSSNDGDRLLVIPSPAEVGERPGAVINERYRHDIYFYQCRFPDCRYAFNNVAQMRVHHGEDHGTDRYVPRMEARASKSSLSTSMSGETND